MYLELLGNAAFYSLNYERKINSATGIRIGVGYLGYTDESYRNHPDESFLVAPLMIFKLWGGEKSNHHFETALGMIYIESREKYKYQISLFGDYLTHKSIHRGVFGTATVGYRYSPKNRGFLFRVGFTPIFSTGNISAWLGTSLGYAF